MRERFDEAEQIEAALSFAQEQADRDSARDAAIFVGLWPEDDKDNIPEQFIDIGIRWLHAFRELSRP